MIRICLECGRIIDARDDEREVYPFIKDDKELLSIYDVSYDYCDDCESSHLLKPNPYEPYGVPITREKLEKDFNKSCEAAFIIDTKYPKCIYCKKFDLDKNYCNETKCRPDRKDLYECDMEKVRKIKISNDYGFSLVGQMMKLPHLYNIVEKEKNKC